MIKIQYFNNEKCTNYLMEKKCLFCGKVFENRVSDYCSLECAECHLNPTQLAQIQIKLLHTNSSTLN